MFKKIAVIVVMLGIVGGAIFTPLLSRAEDGTTVPTGVTINITNGGVDTAGVWTIKMDIVHDYAKYGEPQAELFIDEVQNGNTGVKTTIPRVVKIIPDPNTTQVTGLTSFTAMIQSAPVIRKGYSYSATVKLRIADPKIAPAVSNILSFTSNQAGEVTNENSQTGAQTSASAGVSTLPQCDIMSSDTWGGCMARIVYYAFFVPTSFVFSLSGQFLDWAMGFTLDSASYKGGGAAFVESGWKITRDIANMLFIVILLYAGITTIVDAHIIDAKKTVIMTIVIALLLNFSLFFARIIIDTSNILGGVFYNSICGGSYDSSGNCVSSNVPNPWINPNTKNISVAIVSKFNPQTLFQQAGSLQLTTQSGVEDSTDYSTGPPPFQFAIISLIMTIINCIGIWLFVTVAILFVGRVAGLWLLMIFSPIAFISYIMPKGSSKMLGDMHHSKWWDKLLAQAFVVPIFMFFMYLVLKFMSSNFFRDAFTARTTPQVILGVLIPLIIIVMLLSKARKVALDMSGEIGSSIVKYGTNIAGGAVGALAGGYAMIGRATLGRAAYNASTNQSLRDSAARGNIAAKAGLALSNTFAQASFDPRNTVLGKELSAKTGMNLNKGLSFAGLDTKSTDGGYLGKEARKAEKREKYKKSLGYDEHAYQEQEEKIEKEKDKQSKYKDIKEDLANRIRIEKEQMKLIDKTDKDGLKAKQQEIAALTAQFGVVEQNIRAFEKGGSVFAINKDGQYLDKDGKVVDDKSKAMFSTAPGIQNMEKDKERIKTAREKAYESSLRKQSGRVYEDDELDDLHNIKKFGKEITKEELASRKNLLATNKAQRLKVEGEERDSEKRMQDLMAGLKDAVQKKNKAAISDFTNKLAKEKAFKESLSNQLVKASEEEVKAFNSLQRAEKAEMPRWQQSAKQLTKEFLEGATKGGAAGFVVGSVMPGIGNVGGAVGGAVIGGLKQAFMDYSGKTNASHAAGHIPHYHGKGGGYQAPSGGSHDTPTPHGHDESHADDHGHGGH